MSKDSVKLSFLPWLRRGLGTLVDNQDAASPRASLDVELKITGSSSFSVPRRIELCGPGDVVGLHQEQILRCEPRDGAADFASNFFPAIEFRSPDLPWLLTPTSPTADGHLQPWLALVVVEDRALEQPPDRLPVLQVAPDELPPATETWAWAHVQIADAENRDLETLLREDPSKVLSRLLCPRKLAAHRRYLACVVPTFEIGRRAGLGAEVAETGGGQGMDALAWGPNDNGDAADGKIALPVYFHWRFATGPEGDFESLVRLLRPGLASRELTESRLEVPLGESPVTLKLEGALISPRAEPEDCPQEVRGWLKDELDRQPGKARLTPPLYGWRYTGQHRLDDGPLWFQQLNLDPRARIAAAAGARLVRRLQAELVHKAWRRVGENAEANQVLREIKTATAVQTAALRQHLAPLATAELLQRAGPSLAVLRAAGHNLEHQLRASRIPAAMASGAFRRLCRPDGPLANRLQLPATATAGPTPKSPNGAPGPALLNAVNRGEVAADVAHEPSSGTATRSRLGQGLQDRNLPSWKSALARLPLKALSLAGVLAAIVVAFILPQLAVLLAVTAALCTAGSIATAGVRRRLALAERLLDPTGYHPEKVRAAPPRPFFTLPGLPAAATASGASFGSLLFRDSPQAAAFREAAAEHQSYAARAQDLARTQPSRPALDMASFSQTLKASLQPKQHAAARLQARLAGPGTTFEPDRLWPALEAHPRFSEPLRTWLTEEEKRTVLLRGAHRLVANTVTVLRLNPRYVEAFLVGANHEMAQECLWRELPVELRGTFFRRFWTPGTGTDDDPGDIDPIHAWPWRSALGENTHPESGEKLLIVLIRGELIHRFPTVSLTLSPAKQGIPDPDEILAPVLRGRLGEDILYLGFALSLAEALGSASSGDEGWFVIIRERYGKPRFGLDHAAGVITEDPASWNDLSWGHVVPEDDDLDDVKHLCIEKTRPLAAEEPAGLAWGQDAAHMAAVTLQKPFLFAVHASQMLPEDQEL